MIKLPLLQGKDPVVNRYQTQLQQALSPITSNPIASGTIIPNVNLIAGQENKVPTSLGAPITAWVLCRVRGQANIWDTNGSHPGDTQYLYLNTSSNVNVDVLVC